MPTLQTTEPLYHPITGARFRDRDRELVSRDYLGEVTRVVYDADNKVIFTYADGHLFVIRVDGKEIVFEALYPRVIA